MLFEEKFGSYNEHFQCLAVTTNSYNASCLAVSCLAMLFVFLKNVLVPCENLPKKRPALRGRS